MNTCNTCKHWKRDSRTRVYDSLTGEEIMVDSLPGKCLMTESTMGDPDYPKSKAMAFDADAYSAYLLTAPDFGCVQHQPKEATSAD